MPIGRRIYAIGGNPRRARSIRGSTSAACASRLFVISGLVCAIAGIVFTARLANARANNALGIELDVITIVLLGGVSVFGGRGKLTGVLWALVLIATLRNILGTAARSAATRRALVIGLLLIGSLLVSNVDAGFLSRGCERYLARHHGERVEIRATRRNRSIPLRRLRWRKSEETTV